MTRDRTPRKAVLLAAGFGTRMRPLSYDLPKPMMPLHGTPLIGRAIDMMVSWGVREFLVNLHHHPQPLFLYLRDRALTDGIRIHFSHEPELLDTAGALRRASWFIGDDAFWMFNTDVSAELDPRPILNTYRRHRPIAALWLTDHAGPRTVEKAGGRIRTFRSASPGADGTFTFCGLHLVSPRILDWIPDEESAYSIITAYTRALAAGEEVLGVTVAPSKWCDLGTPAAYLRVHAQGTGAPSDGGADRTASCISPSARISARARLSGCVVWDGARIGPHARLRDTIVGRGADVNVSAVSGSIVRGDWIPVRPALTAALAACHWHPRDVSLHTLDARGSDRSFTRILRGRESAVLIEYGDARPENASYGDHARFLKRHGVPVPAVIAERADLRMLLLEDVGDLSLEEHVSSLSPRTVERHYRSVLDAALTLHGVSRSACSRLRLQPPFSPRLYRWERELMADCFLRGFLGLSETRVAGILSELQRVSRQLARAPRVLVHRDLQSSNILLGGGTGVLIDFQGMRWGPAAYDVASLLCDPYVMLPSDLQERLLEYYLDRCSDPDAVRISFWPAAVQRLSQALGAYGRLAARPETARFSRHIGSGLAMLQRASDRCRGYPCIRALCEEYAPGEGT